MGKDSVKLEIQAKKKMKRKVIDALEKQMENEKKFLAYVCVVFKNKTKVGV